MALLALSGCASSTLTPEAREVKIAKRDQIDAARCYPWGKGVFKTPEQSKNASRTTILEDLRNDVAAKGFNVGATTFNLSAGGGHDSIPVGTEIPVEYFKCHKVAWDKIKNYE